MTTKKKAFKVIYNLIVDGVLAEKEAYNLIEGIFDREVMQIPVPVPTQVDLDQDNQQEQIQQIEVAGFRLSE